MGTDAQFSPRIRFHFSWTYLAGAVVRVLSVTAFLFLPYAILGGAFSGDHRSFLYRLWTTPFETIWADLGPAIPLAIVAIIAECQISLLRGVGFSAAAVHLLLPAALACVGGYFGYLRFVDGTELFGPVARSFVFGSALLFFLAASFHTWYWHVWMFADPGRTPLLWYIGLVCVAGTFFGSCIAASAPSPYLKVILKYREQHWNKDRISPTDNMRPIEDPPGY